MNTSNNSQVIANDESTALNGLIDRGILPDIFASPGMKPDSKCQSPTVCVVCWKVYEDEKHFKDVHADLEKWRRDEFLYIGRFIISRLRFPFHKSEFVNEKNPVELLKQALSKLYGTVPTNQLHPSSQDRTAISFQKYSQKINNYLLREELENKLFINLEQIDCNRDDCRKHNNSYCPVCSKWIQGRWSNHRHPELRLSKVEKQVIQSCAVRMKFALAKHLLILDDEALAKMTTNFFDYFEERKISFNSELPLGGLLSCSAVEPVPSSSRLKKQQERKEAMPTIRQGKQLLEFGRAIPVSVLMASVNNVKKYFNKSLGGFVLLSATKYLNPTSAIRAQLKRQNPMNKDCLNFINKKTWHRKKGVWGHHVATALYRCVQNDVLVYDSCKVTREKDLHADYRHILRLLYLQSKDRINVAQLQKFAIQSDRWSCTLHSFYAFVLLMAELDPCGYTIKLEGVWNMVKVAYECKGAGLKNMKLPDIVKTIAERKPSFRKEKLNYEVLFKNEDDQDSRNNTNTN